MIIGWYLLLELNIDLCLSNDMIKDNGGAYKGYTAPMKYSSNLRDNSSFRYEELWGKKRVLDSTRLTRTILDTKYQKSDLSQIVSKSKHLNDNKQSMLHDLLTKYKFLFNGTLGT